VEVVRHPGNRSTGTWHDAQQPLWPERVLTNKMPCGKIE
jgi:hypothetical protein